MTIEGGEEINCLNKSFVHSSQVVNLIVIGHNNFFIGSFSFSLSLSCMHSDRCVKKVSSGGDGRI